MLEKIKELLAETFGISENLINEDTSITDDIAPSPEDLSEFLMNLEEVFDVDISEDEFDEMLTVGDIMERLKSEGIEE
ncbi:MAG: phosphopantetheine-binding protein [Clostridiales bacterium]|nr:phosphopantetheine-binding protein [Clostridiales bacterium]